MRRACRPDGVGCPCLATRGEPFLMNTCDHPISETRYMRHCRQIKRQCVTCGQSTSNALPHSEFTTDQIKSLPDFDNDLRDEWWKKSTQERKQGAEEIAEECKRRLEDRKLFYLSHLSSKKWQAKRRRVIEREKNLCQGCRLAPIEEVHHLSYDHLGDELLFELAGLCAECHRKTHGKDGH